MTPPRQVRDPADAALRGTFTAQIGQNLGEPSADVLNRLLDIYGHPLSAQEVFILPTQATNSLVDSYFTYMRASSLRNYVLDFAQGRSLMLGHAWGDQAVGQTFAAELQQEPGGGALSDNTDQTRAHALLRRDLLDTGLDAGEWLDPLGFANWRDVPPPGNAITRCFVNAYIVRGMQSSAQVANDDVIRAVETRTYRDVSIGFEAGDIICELCGQSVIGPQCPHIPGCIYPAPGARSANAPAAEQIAFAGVENGHALELSFGFAHATPDAGVVPAKVARLVESERLTRREAARLQFMETRIGRRLAEPAQYARARTATFVVPRLGGSPMPNSPTPARRGSRDTTAPPAPPAADTSNVESAVSTGATAQAAALADQLAALDAQITDQQAIAQGLQDQMSALSTQADANGDPIDNSAQITALQGQLDAANTLIADLQTERDAIQAELDAINGVASDTGGTPTDAPASPAAGAPPATGTNLARRARAAATMMRGLLDAQVAPLVTGRRDVAPADLQAVIDALNSVVSQLQSLISAAGGTPPPTGTNLLIEQALGRAFGGRVTFARVRQLIVEAADGRTALALRRDDYMRALVRAYGAENCNEPVEREKIKNLSLSTLSAEIARLDEITARTLRSGRSVYNGGALQLLQQQGDEGDDDRIPPTMQERQQQARQRRRRDG